MVALTEDKTMAHWETMWNFHTKNFSISWQIAPEDDADLSFDDTGEVAEKINDGTYQCFMSRMIVYCKGQEVGCDYLGNSIYENPADFRDHIGARGKYGSYFTSMVHSAIAEARKNVCELQSLRVRCA